VPSFLPVPSIGPLIEVIGGGALLRELQSIAPARFDAFKGVVLTFLRGSPAA
jgi:hypothetical protein